jgi:hypothetical protein
MRGLTDVIYSCIVMTYEPRQRRPKSRTSEPCSRPAATVRSTARCRRAISPRLLHFHPAGLSVFAASPTLEGTSSSGRIQVGVYGQASTQFDSACAVVRICQKNLDQRSRDSSAVGALATQGRSWLSRRRSWRAAFNWSIILIACCQKNWLRCISYLCPIGGGPLEGCPPNPMQLFRR